MAIKKLDSYVLERARRGDHEAFSAIFEEYGKPVAGYLYRLLGDTVGRVLSQLPKDYAACLILHYHQGFSYAEAAEILGLPLTTFKMRLYRARQAFQQAYQQEETGEKFTRPAAKPATNAEEED